MWIKYGKHGKWKNYGKDMKIQGKACNKYEKVGKSGERF